VTTRPEEPVIAVVNRSVRTDKERGFCRKSSEKDRDTKRISNEALGVTEEWEREVQFLLEPSMIFH
jgi:hypothetical protein